MNHCPLCGFLSGTSFGKKEKRQFAYCSACTLVFVPEAYHIAPEQERARYALHNNTVENAGYVRFLTEVADSVLPFVSVSTHVLDFGSGEHAVLTHLLRERGVHCEAFDPMYSPTVQEKPNGYDIVILCEVIEHCRNLTEVINSIQNQLSPEGVVCIRTQCYPEVSAIPAWWYAQDLTHINLFSITALEFLAQRLGRTLSVSPQKNDIYLIT